MSLNVCGCGAAPDADIGVAVRGVYDGILIWQCRKCGAYRPRFSEGRLHDLGVALAEKWNAQ